MLLCPGITVYHLSTLVNLYFFLGNYHLAACGDLTFVISPCTEKRPPLCVHQCSDVCRRPSAVCRKVSTRGKLALGSVGSKFKQQLSDLMDKLNSTVSGRAEPGLRGRRGDAATAGAGMRLKAAELAVVTAGLR